MARSNKQRISELVRSAEWLASVKGEVMSSSFIYTDEKVNICDDPGPLLQIVLVELDEVVFQVRRENLWFGDDIKVVRYRPGKWEEYVLDLAKKGREEIDPRERERKQMAFKPIDDSHLFGGKE